MPSAKDYLDFFVEQFSWLENISCRAMMSEYVIIYNREKIIGWKYYSPNIF